MFVQIEVQQVESEQPGVKFGIQQLRALSPPQDVVGEGQLACARVTQSPSQTSLQQKASIAQTVLQHAPSAHRGVPCSWKQLPESGSPQVSQTAEARMAHWASHATLQQ